jgi:hypothetical protein
MVSGLYLYTAADRDIQRGQVLTRRTVEAVPTSTSGPGIDILGGGTSGTLPPNPGKK